MNIFVLCTGRCGSTTFAKACAHMTNYSVGHESLVGRIGADRLAYGPNHIEVDHRLAWQLGRLDDRFGTSAFYVHLTRDPVATAQSWAQRYTLGTMIASYRRGMIGNERVSRYSSALEMVETATANITQFLNGKHDVIHMRLDRAEEDFPRFWHAIGAEGSLDSALSEWRIRHNEGAWRPPLLTVARAAARRAFRAAVPRP